MTDWLARFRELVKDDSRFSLGADSAIRANSSPLNGDRGADTRKTSAIGAIGPFGTAARESGRQSDTPNQSVEIDWQSLFDERAAIREYDGRHTRAEAEWLAWGELENRWHMQYGERIARDICAGCRKPIGNSAAIDLIDGNRVHCNRSNDCLILHGRRWRNAASHALVACGINQPKGAQADGSTELG
jgi:hypothetical protein